MMAIIYSDLYESEGIFGMHDCKIFHFAVTVLLE